MSSPDDRLDTLIDDVAREMTEAQPRDLAMEVVARARGGRPRSPWLVPIGAAAVAATIVVAIVELRAPTRHAPGTTATPSTMSADARTATREAPAAEHPAPSIAPVAPGTQHPAPATRHPAPGARIPLPPPLVTDLTPSPLDVVPVDVPPIDQPIDLSPSPLVVAPLPIEPIDTRGGLR